MAKREKTEAERAAHRAYFNRYRKERKRQLNLLIEPAHHARLKRAAKAHNLPLGRFVIASSLAYLGRQYLVPDPDQVRELSLELRRIGVNLNQLARLGWTSGITGSVQEFVTALERRVTGALTDPRDFLSVIGDELRANPALKDELIRMLREVG